MKIETESAMFQLRLAALDEIEHTNPDPTLGDVPIMATSQAGEQIYMLVRYEDLVYLVNHLK